MEAIHNINLASLLDTLVSLVTAFLLGGVIGFERQYRQRTAGLRTNLLVAVGAAIFVDMANRIYGHEGAVRVVAYVVSGIGFLGAGVIMREGGNVRGLNTAATLWGSAAVGACAGADLILEATNTIYVIAVKEKQKQARQLLEQALEEANYPIGDLVIHSFGTNEVEIEATLTATSIDGDELDHVTRQLAEHDSVIQAFWSPSTAE